MKQVIPDVYNTEPTLYTINLRHVDWFVQLAPYLMWWHSHANFITTSSLVDVDGDMTPNYMEWYENITRHFITRGGAHTVKQYVFQVQNF